MLFRKGESLRDFCREAGELSRSQTCFIDPGKESDALIYFTCLPWVELTAMTNERDRSAPEAAEDSIPRVAWGKYREEDGRLILGLSLELNHRLLDGLHVGLFAEVLTKLIRNLR